MLQEPSRQGFQHKACWFELDKLYLYSPSNARVGPHRTFILSTNELQNEFPYTRPLYESPNMNFDKSSWECMKSNCVSMDFLHFQIAFSKL